MVRLSHGGALAGGHRVLMCRVLAETEAREHAPCTPEEVAVADLVRIAACGNMSLSTLQTMLDHHATHYPGGRQYTVHTARALVRRLTTPIVHLCSSCTKCASRGAPCAFLLSRARVSGNLHVWTYSKGLGWSNDEQWPPLAAPSITLAPAAPGALCPTRGCRTPCPSSFSQARDDPTASRFIHIPVLPTLKRVRYDAWGTATRVSFIGLQLLMEPDILEAMLNAHKSATGFWASEEFARLADKYGMCRRPGFLDIAVTGGSDAVQPKSESRFGTNRQHSTTAMNFTFLSLPDHMRSLRHLMHIACIIFGPRAPTSLQPALSRVMAEIIALYGPNGEGASCARVRPARLTLYRAGQASRSTRRQARCAFASSWWQAWPTCAPNRTC